MSGDNDSPKMPPEWRAKKPMGESLRDKYKEVLNEPVPEKLKKLIEALKKQEQEDQKRSDGD
ncbi:MAG: NepR family anti-sigma factor [Pseudomonadota bacterium]